MLSSQELAQLLKDRRYSNIKLTNTDKYDHLNFTGSDVKDIKPDDIPTQNTVNVIKFIHYILSSNNISKLTNLSNHDNIRFACTGCYNTRLINNQKVIIDGYDKFVEICVANVIQFVYHKDTTEINCEFVGYDEICRSVYMIKVVHFDGKKDNFHVEDCDKLFKILERYELCKDPLIKKCSN